jgi:hypothetical protein
MKRIQIRKGDIFEVPVGNGKMYFQYIGLDLTQLNSEVIRSFKNVYSKEESPNIDEIINDEIEFHAHTMIRLGYNMELYKKFGNSTRNLVENVTWRQSEDSGDPKVKISKRWVTWKTGKEMVKIKYNIEELSKTEIGSVHNPIDVVEKMKNGDYQYFHHKFK